MQTQYVYDFTIAKGSLKKTLVSKQIKNKIEYIRYIYVCIKIYVYNLIVVVIKVLNTGGHCNM